ncbi:prephenate dehydrogenase/arogenate dehydrogenase family protein [Candidatus Nomurabacteria bacterium]|nr:prephenate dehydrogenase/arogenate dehydrogenase family protein [Candidatus Nomurabacteria bacterium]
MSEKFKVGIIGYGDFTKVMVEYLSPYAEIIVSSREYKSGNAGHGAKFARLDRVLASPIIIPSIPSQFFEEFFSSNSDLINPNALVIDVCSVKVKPLATLEKLLPKTCSIIGTHPMFGPASIKKNGGIDGLRCVVSTVRASEDAVKKLETFVTESLKLKLLRRTAEEHDKEMAYVQGLSHYIARLMDIMNIPESELSTLAYDELLAMKKIQAKDTWDLFESIMHDNPYAIEINKKFKHAQNKLDSKIKLLKNK